MFGSLLPDDEKISQMKPQGDWASWFSQSTGVSPDVASSIASYQQPGLMAHSAPSLPDLSKLVEAKKGKTPDYSKSVTTPGMIPATPYGGALQVPPSTPSVVPATTSGGGGGTHGGGGDSGGDGGSGGTGGGRMKRRHDHSST
jgi:hypothetical protein